jgi:hypothetical protein
MHFQLPFGKGFFFVRHECWKKAIELGHQATALDREGKYQEALDVYKLSIEHFMLVWKYEQNPSFKQRLEGKIDEYLRRAEQLKAHLEKKVCLCVPFFLIIAPLRPLHLLLRSKMAKRPRIQMVNHRARVRVIS